MIKCGKAKLFLWILSLAIGPVVYFILLLTVSGSFNMASIKGSFIELIDLWVGGFVLVWVIYWLSKFTVKYGSFM